MDSLWSGIFHNPHPVEIEIGSGTGTFLLPAAQRSPQINFLGIEHSHSRAVSLDAMVREQQLANVVVLNADATCVVGHMVPQSSVAAYHIYFPDPWWKRRHHRRRLFTAGFVADLVRTLQPHGRLFVATDVELVFDLILKTIATQPSLQLAPELRPPRREPTTFERKGLRRGATIHAAAFARHA